MTDQPEPNEPKPDTQAGVFGNLPDARPGTRSPRRDGASKRNGAKKAPAATKAKAATNAQAKATPKAAKPKVAKPAPRADAPPAAPREPQRPVGEQQPGGLADVAWAGIAVAAEAATIGVRLASRAIEAVRGNSERD